MLVAALALTLHGTAGTAAHAAPTSGDIQKKIDKASDDLEDVVESYNKMREDLKATKAAEKNLAASLAPARQQLAVASAEVSTMAVSAYKSGQVGAVNAVLEGPGDLMQRQIDTYRQTTEQYESRQAALRNTQVKQTAQVKELAARKGKIEKDLTKLYAMRKVAFGSATEKGERYSGDVPAVSGSAGAAVRFAFSTIGLPYSYGADGPGSYDCSGLTSAAWGKAGRSLPHNAAAQWGVVSHISRSELRPGDLVFYRALKHVGIYVGGGMIIDASRAGQPVKHRDMDVMPPYGYGRVA
jgi:cell wall-associated NlpC family hydrolase